VYARIKRAATVVQAAMRGKVARNQLFKSLSSAVVLQRAMRRFSCRSKFVSFRMASCRIQASVRGHRQRSKYLRLNRNLLVLQRYGRGIVARQLLGEKSAAALVLQRCWRGTQGQLLAVKRLYSILMIQKVWRGFQEQTNLAQQLSNQLVLIQSVWRASIWRGRYRTYRSSASMIQSSMRRYLVRKTLQHNVRGVLSIQRIWRGYRKRVYLDVKAREETRVSILLQAKWRMYSAYKIHNASRGVAIILQARWRGRIARNAHREARSSAILIQSYWRTVQARESYSNARTSATMIQSLARGVAARNAISGLHLLSVNIQRNWRGHRDRRKCRLLLQNKQEVEDLASTRIQAYWRMRHSSLELKISLAAATSIQKHWRSSLDREQYSIVRSSCAMIQCHIRGALARTNIALWHLSAVQIQKHWRGYRGVQDFTAMDIANKSVLQEQHLAADRIQSVWRVAQARRTFKLTLVAAVLIQKHWRSSLARERYLLARASALMIQSIVRGVSFRTYLRRMHSSATSVQRVWRGRCQLQEYQLLIQKQAARRIQRNWRMTRSRHSLKISLLSAVLMQKHWRSSLARERYLLARASALMIQSIVRGVSFRRYLRRMHSSATEVQRVWRGRCQLKEYNKVKLGLANDSTSLSDDSKKAHSRDATCINILDNVNMENRGVEFAVGIEQTSKDQNGLQRTLNQNAPSALQVLQDLLNCSATQIQRTYRGSAARGILRSHRDLQNCSATQIQALWRGSVARSSIRFDRGIWMSSAIFIQSRVRGCITRDLVKQQTKAALSIQRVWRGRSLQLAFLQRTMEETLTLELEESSKYHAAVTLQAFVRCRAAGARFKFLRNACIVIQSFIRRQQNIKRFQASMTAITLIQKHWKGSVDRRAFEKLRMCAIVIQSFFRMTRVLQDWWFLRFPEEKRNILEDAARKIQVAFFLWKMKLAVWQMQSSAIILQRSIRGQLVRSAARFALVHMNASFRNSVILSFARVVAGNDQEYAPTAIAWGDAVLKAKLSACTVIQSAARRMLAKRKVASDFGVEFGAELCMDQSRIEEEGSSAIVIQRAFRCKLSAKAGYTKQVVTLQTIYRGWKARKCYATILESRSRARHRETTHAAIQIQRTVRKMLSRVEGAKRRLLHTEKARSASTCLLERIEKSSKAVVDKLLYASEGNADVGPCIRRLAGRVRAACDEAAFHSANALPDYAKQFQCSGTVEPIKGDVVVTKSMSSLHVTTDVSTALPAQSIAEKGVSTPVRCNTTPSQDKTRTCPISQESDKVERQDNTRGLAIQARELLLIGRSATGMVHGTKHVLSVPSSSLKDHKKDDQAYQDTPQRSGERKDGSKSDNSLLFCDSKNMPSPIKKEADWDWADEW
jgi:myosin heavy subunit